MSSFYSEEEIKELGLKNYGKNVLISKKSSLYGASQIEIGDNVRIDDFTILSGRIRIGSYVHIAAYSALYAGSVGIELEDFTCISSRVAVYAISDDYTGKAMTNPTIPDKCRKVIEGKVTLKKHVLVGTGSTVLPGVCIGEGAAIGAMSLVLKSIEPWSLSVGVPCRKIKERSKEMLKYESYISK